MSVILGTVDDVLTAVPAMKVRAVLRELEEVGAVWENEPFNSKYSKSVKYGELLPQSSPFKKCPYALLEEGHRDTFSLSEVLPKILYFS